MSRALPARVIVDDVLELLLAPFEQPKIFAVFNVLDQDSDGTLGAADLHAAVVTLLGQNLAQYEVAFKQ